MKFKPGNSGMSLLEFCVAVSLISIFIGLTLYKAWNVMAAAEKITVSQILNDIRINLMLNVIQQQTSRDLIAIQKKSCLNPMSFLPIPPSNYIGNLDKISDKDELGKWYFNTTDCELIYQWRFVYNINGIRIRPDTSRYYIKKNFTDRTVLQTLTLESKK